MTPEQIREWAEKAYATMLLHPIRPVDFLEQAARELLAMQDREYICKCGVRVVPHRCPTTEEF